MTRVTLNDLALYSIMVDHCPEEESSDYGVTKPLATAAVYEDTNAPALSLPREPWRTDNIALWDIPVSRPMPGQRRSEICRSPASACHL